MMDPKDLRTKTQVYYNFLFISSSKYIDSYIYMKDQVTTLLSHYHYTLDNSTNIGATLIITVNSHHRLW